MRNASQLKISFYAVENMSLLAPLAKLRVKLPGDFATGHSYGPEKNNLKTFLTLFSVMYAPPPALVYCPLRKNIKANPYLKILDPTFLRTKNQICFVLQPLRALFIWVGKIAHKREG